MAFPGNGGFRSSLAQVFEVGYGEPQVPPDCVVVWNRIGFIKVLGDFNLLLGDLRIAVNPHLPPLQCVLMASGMPLGTLFFDVHTIIVNPTSCSFSLSSA